MVKLKKANVYKVLYEDIEGTGEFEGVYTSRTNKGAYVFVNKEIGHTLIVGEEDVISIEPMTDKAIF